MTLKKKKVVWRQVLCRKKIIFSIYIYILFISFSRSCFMFVFSI